MHVLDQGSTSCSGDQVTTPSSPPASTGLMSTMGVPSMASIGATRNRCSATSNTMTRCSPRGLGRPGDRIANTPVNGTSRFPVDAPAAHRGGHGAAR